MIVVTNVAFRSKAEKEIVNHNNGNEDSDFYKHLVLNIGRNIGQDGGRACESRP